MRIIIKQKKKELDVCHPFQFNLIPIMSHLHLEYWVLSWIHVVFSVFSNSHHLKIQHHSQLHRGYREIFDVHLCISIYGV
jgi:hypothetical protein